MTLTLSERARGLQPSPTLALEAEVRALRARGESVISLAAGEPDFDTPPAIKRAAIQAIRRGATKYTEAAGIPALRQAVARHLTRTRRVRYDPSQTLVTTGAKYAITLALQALVDPGDEVLVPVPYWVSYPAMVRLAGGVPRLVPTREHDAFKVKAEDVDAACTSRTRVLLLNTPNNPAGHVYGWEELEALARVVLRRRLALISDEIYSSLTFGVRHFSPVSIDPRLARRTVVVDGLSKAYAMTGWRMGYAGGPQELIRAMAALQSQTTSNPTSISQHAALAALSGSRAPVERMRRAFQARRDLALALLSDVPGLTVVPPQGAFYLFLNIQAFGLPSAALAERLLREARVAAVPGVEFGAEGYLRLSYAVSAPVLREALTRLAAWFKTLRP